MNPSPPSPKRGFRKLLLLLIAGIGLVVLVLFGLSHPIGDHFVANGSEIEAEVVQRGSLPNELVAPGSQRDLLNNVLYIPRSACCKPYTTVWLFKLSSRGKVGTLTEIHFGGASADKIEILSGARENDAIVVSDMTNWDSVDRVAFAPRVIPSRTARTR
jgi:hypothetical protein